MANPGQDTITFNWKALGTDRPVFSVPAVGTIEVKEGVIINAGNGGQYATFIDFRPFSFTHDGKGAAGVGLESKIVGGVFDKCIVPVNPNVFGFGDCGGAIQVMNGTLTVVNTRFSGNGAFSGGAIAVDVGAKLVIDGDPNFAPPAQPVGDPPIPEHLAPRALFKGNQALAAGRGGAIWSLGEVELRRVWFVENSASDGGGVALTSSGKVTVAAPPVIPPIGGGPPFQPDVSLLRNTARTDGGAVFYNSSSQTSSLDNTLFASNNAAARGGGIAVLKGTLSLTDSKLEANLAPAGAANGAGIHIEGTANSAAKVVATRVTFDNNNGFRGLGVSILSWGEFVSYGCNFSNNNSIWTGRVPVAPGDPLNPLGVYTPDPNNPDRNIVG